MNDSNLSESNIVIIAVAVSIILIIVTVSIIIYRKNNSKKNIKIESKQEIINKKLIKLEKQFSSKAISYYLRSLLLDSNLSEEEQSKLSEEYPAVFSLPRLEWDNFIIINEEGNILDELIKDRIESYDKKDKYTIEDSFRYL